MSDTCHPALVDFSFFYQFYNPFNGNCFIFNSGWNESYRVEKTHKTGRRFGLSVVLNLGEENYMESIGGELGARVMVHSQDEMPHPQEAGIMAEPGHMTSLSVRKVVVERLGHPHGDCRQPGDPGNLDVYAETYPHVAYSKQASTTPELFSVVIKE